MENQAVEKEEKGNSRQVNVCGQTFSLCTDNELDPKKIKEEFPDGLPPGDGPYDIV